MFDDVGLDLVVQKKIRWLKGSCRWYMVTVCYVIYTVYTWNLFVLYFGPKQGLFQSKQGSFGFQVYIYDIHVYVWLCMLTYPLPASQLLSRWFSKPPKIGDVSVPWRVKIVQKVASISPGNPCFCRVFCKFRKFRWSSGLVNQTYEKRCEFGTPPNSSWESFFLWRGSPTSHFQKWKQFNKLSK